MILTWFSLDMCASKENKKLNLLLNSLIILEKVKSAKGFYVWMSFSKAGQCKSILATFSRNSSIDSSDYA